MPPLPQLHPGTVFARDFRVHALLATGGMGSLYIAEQISTGKRRALKIMQPQLVADPKARQRFELEARIGGRIESEHIVEVVGAGVDEATGTPWLAMELLEGQDLAVQIRTRGRISAAELHEIYLQLGEGLGAAHMKGIVHRDLKPENLFIAVSRRRGIPFTLKILDFGIAKITQESKGSDKQTAAMGTPLWMAPEQTEQAELTPTTDVWALGLIAFNALTGRSYWRVANQAEVRLTALFTEMLVAPLDPPSVRAPQLGHNEPLPAGFDHWFLRCVARDRTLRFTDGAAAVAALGAGFTFDAGRAGGGQTRAVAPTAMLDAASAPGGVYGPGGHGAGGGYTPQPAQTPSASRSGYPPAPGSYSPHSPGGGFAAAQQYTPQPQQTPQQHASQPQYAQPQYAQPQYAQHTPPVGYLPPGMPTPSAARTPYSATGAAPAPRTSSALRLVLGLGALGLITMCAAGGSYGAFAGYSAYMEGRTGPPPPPPTADAGAAVVGMMATAPDAGAPFIVPLRLDAGAPDASVETRAAGGGAETTEAAEAEPEGEPEPTATAYRWGEGEVRRFRGSARWTNGLVCDYTLTLNRNGDGVAGFFDWVVREVPAGSPNHPGQHLNEGVYGTFAAPTLTLHSNTAGTTFNYRLSGAGRLTGRDTEGGRVTGRVAR